MLSVVLSLITYLCLSEGFLLEPSTNNASNNPLGNKQYVTFTEFYETKNEQQNDVTFLRHQMDRMKTDSDKTLNLLTSQIQQKLASFEMNETIELNKLQRIIRELQDNNTKLQHNFDNLKVKYTAIETELLSSQKTTAKLVVDIQALEQLKSVQDLKGLKEEVQSIRSQTHSLAFNQQARNQDFLALYNVTINNQKNVNLLGQQQADFKNQTLDFFGMIFRYYFSFKSDTNRRINQNKLSINRTDARVDKATEKVAMTSCVSADNVLTRGETIKFNDVHTHVGIDNLSSFQTTGKFNCTKDGLYVVSVWLLAQTASLGDRVYIYKNTEILTYTFIKNSQYYDTGPATAAVELKVNDKVYVHFDKGKVDSYGSCMTIIKIM